MRPADAAGNVFAVAWGAGIDYCNTQKLKFAHYFTQQIAQNAQLSNNFVRCICPANNGTTWCGTQNDGIVVFSPEHVLLQHVALTASGLPTTSIDFLLFDRQTLYAATPEGLFGCANWQTPHPHFVAIPFADGSAHPITHLCYSQNTLFASYDKGIASLRNNRLVPLAHIAPDYYTLVFALGNTLLCSTPTQLCALPMLPAMYLRWRGEPASIIATRKN